MKKFLLFFRNQSSRFGKINFRDLFHAFVFSVIVPVFEWALTQFNIVGFDLSLKMVIKTFVVTFATFVLHRIIKNSDGVFLKKDTETYTNFKD